MDAIEVRDVTKTFGNVTAVDDLTLTVPQGSVYGFIGPNGSGKTTTMRMIVNIFYPDRGDDPRIRARAGGERSNEVGYLPEERGLYRRMDVRRCWNSTASCAAAAASPRKSTAGWSDWTWRTARRGASKPSARA